MHTYARQPLAIESGHGVWVRDDDGRELIDLVGGIGVNVLGHAHPAVRQALSEQSARLIHTSNLYFTAAQVELAERLVATAFPARVFLCNSGSEASETAIKLVRKWGRSRRGGATGMVVLKGGFHGRTLGALAATAQPRYREPFEPLPPGFVHVAADLDAIAAAAGEGIAAVMLEPIRGRPAWSRCQTSLWRAYAHCATSATCCSSSTRCRRAWAGRAAGGRTSTPGSPPT